MMKQLLVPITVSHSLRGSGRKLHNETKAFVPLYEDPEWLAGKRRKRRIAEPLPKDLWPMEIHQRLRKIAHDSEYFTKPTSKRALNILRILNHFGIRTEEPMEYLKNGRSLFKKKGWGLDSKKGSSEFLQRYAGNVLAVQKMVALMHGIGITHGHLHLGNIAIERGKIVFLDSFKARFFDFSPQSRRQTLEKIKNDLWGIADALAMLRVQGNEMRKINSQDINRASALAQAIVNGIVLKYPPNLKATLTPKEQSNLLDRFEFL